MIRTKSLQFAYSDTKNRTFCFPDIDLPAKEDILILGPSGVGKTTLLHLLAGLLPPKEGDVFIANTCLNKLTRKQLDCFHRTKYWANFSTRLFYQIFILT